MSHAGTTRRTFLKQAAPLSAAAVAAPTVVPARALGKEGVPPSERVAMGCIGYGTRGRFLLGRFLSLKDAEVVALCDVDRRHLEAGNKRVEKERGSAADTHHDFRSLLDRDDLDAVAVATPDHWHALISVAAAQAGKDIYCEKPLANSVVESRAILDAVQRHDRVLQVGTHERSRDNCRRACELVRAGHIGELERIDVHLPTNQSHHKKAQAVEGIPSPMAVPEPFDYDFWLGHTMRVPYTEKRCHFWWRFNLRYGGGEMTDRGAHVMDIAQLGAGKDGTTPVAFKGGGERDPDSLYDTFWSYNFVNTYADGLKMVGSNKSPRGVKFQGSEGWIFVHIHGGKLEADPASLLKKKVGDDASLGRSPGHQRNFLDAVKREAQPVAPASAGHHTAVICHLNNIERLAFDPKKEQIPNSEAAHRMLSPTMREPWSL